MTTEKITPETNEYLVGKTIIGTGPNYIRLDTGLHIYLDDSEIEHLNSFNEKDV